MLDEPESNFDKHSPAEGSSTEEFLASVTCVDDPTPTRRWMDAIRTINKGQDTRKKGIDIKHLVLQCPPTIVETGSMASETGADPQCEVIIDRIVKQRRLNGTKVDAINLACTTKTGLATIQDRLSFGKKTDVLGAIGEIQVEIGRQVKRRRCGLAIAPSHGAVERLAESFLADNPQEMECVWYMGTFWTEPKGLKDLGAWQLSIGTIV